MLRRSLLLAAAATAVSLPRMERPAKAAAEPAGDRQALHVLDRLAFGPTEGDLRHVQAIGVERYIAEQLDPDNLPELPELTRRLAGLPTLRLDPAQLYREYGPLPARDGAKPTPEEKKARRQRARIILEEACAARLWRALDSPRQLHEVMVDFWYNHFNVFAGKDADHLWIGAYERDAIRPHALGRFRQLLEATSHHPAMLVYLDNAQNCAPGTVLPNGRPVGLNENYARELMELHTLGVDGGYSQADVIALARVLTGWGLARPYASPAPVTAFHFYPARHDNGAKHFLHHDIAANGAGEAEEALDLLADSPATARHIAGALAQYFVSDTPPPALVDRLARRFQDSGGEIRSVLVSLFASSEFRARAGTKYKSPYRYVLSAARAAGVRVDNPQPLLGMMARLGQPLYRCPTPDGYRDSEAAWLSPDATLLRIDFATALAAGRLPLHTAPPWQEGQRSIPAAAPEPQPVDPAPLQAMLVSALSRQTQDAIAATPTELRSALILGSPDFMRR